MEKKVFYQPILTAEEWQRAGLPSFGVYHSLENAKKDFPNKTIGAFTEDDIEGPTFMDVPDTPTTIVKVRGGCVVEVLHNVEGLEVVILDADIEDCSTEDLLYFEDGVYYGYVGQIDEYSPERCKGFDPEDKVDLFKHLNWLPNEVKEIAEEMVNDPDGIQDYVRCAEYLKQIESLGYTFDYGLDGIPFGLKEKE